MWSGGWGVMGMYRTSVGGEWWVCIGHWWVRSGGCVKDIGG